MSDKQSTPSISSSSSSSSPSSSTSNSSAPCSSSVPPAASGLKICCACPETRKPRDECVVKFGEENCQDLILAHKVCLRAAGFNV